jgi:cytochrome c
MSGLEVNKIIASIIVAILIIVIIGYAANIVMDNNSEEKSGVAYKIELPESNLSETATTPKIESAIEPIAALLMNASIEKGEKIYKKCGSCHNYEKGSVNKVGPNLWNIINRTKAGIDGFAYSDALTKTGGVWSYEELAAFVYKPKEYIVGTKMNFAGLKKVEDRANLVLFLRNQSDNPAPLP